MPRFAPPLAVVCLLAAAAHAGITPMEDRPLADDDPKLARVRLEQPRTVPRFKLAYRYLPMASPVGGGVLFHAVEFDAYPVSNYLRLGFGVDGGYGGGALDAFYLTISATFGAQYPAVVTPFIEGRFAFGLIGGRYQGEIGTSLLYTGGIEGGLEFYAWKRFFVSGALGWTHPTYNAPDLVYLKAHPNESPPIKKFANDAITFKLGIGF